MMWLKLTKTGSGKENAAVFINMAQMQYILPNSGGGSYIGSANGNGSYEVKESPEEIMGKGPNYQPRQPK